MKANEEKSMPEKLRELAAVDIKTVDPENLVDIDSVKIKKDLPIPERVGDFIEKIRNPYCYVSHGIVVKVSFSGDRKLEECLQACISMEI